MDFNAAIFDLDGTILDSMDVWEHIDIQFLKKRNLLVPENYVTEILMSLMMSSIAEDNSAICSAV